MVNRRFLRFSLTAVSVSLLAFAYAGASVLADGSWEPVGPSGSDVWSLAPSPAYETDQTLFVGTFQGGILRSTNSGDSWHRINEEYGGSSFRTLAVSPDFEADKTVFAGGPDGVFRSTDGGDTWQMIVKGIDDPRIFRSPRPPISLKTRLS